jgi:O-acetyl-ADP-ribose deacetylase (regulator of RNase III)/uncharacterized protein YwgA
MIHYTKGDIFDAQTEAIVNTVNTVGVMGKGIALQFKKRFPENFSIYKKACDNNELQIGEMLLTQSNSLFFKYIINFPTKVHWKSPSKYEYIENGLESLVKLIETENIRSIAIPPLGAGNGKLEWSKIKTILEKYLNSLAGVEILVYEPQKIFEQRDNIKKTPSQTNLTPVRAMLLHLFNEYEKIDQSLNLLVSQKLAYFFQRFGEPLRLRYNKGWYGPYAANLNKVLQALNGVYINYAAQYDQPATRINLVVSRMDSVERMLAQLSDEQKVRLELVKDFFRGFETPFSLELLGTVDWILQQHPDYTHEQIHKVISNWTKRKANLIRPYHVQMAYEHLMNYRKQLYN